MVATGKPHADKTGGQRGGPMWNSLFTESQRKQMLEEDLVAGMSGPLVITGVLTAGLILAILGICLMV